MATGDSAGRCWLPSRDKDGTAHSHSLLRDHEVELAQGMPTLLTLLSLGGEWTDQQGFGTSSFSSVMQRKKSTSVSRCCPPEKQELPQDTRGPKKGIAKCSYSFTNLNWLPWACPTSELIQPQTNGKKNPNKKISKLRKVGEQLQPFLELENIC